MKKLVGKALWYIGLFIVVVIIVDLLMGLPIFTTALWVDLIIGITLLIIAASLLKGEDSAPRSSFVPSSKSINEPIPVTHSFPMKREWDNNVTNAVKIVFDCCCEFYVFSMNCVIPLEVVQPEQFKCYIGVDDKIHIWFDWKTNYYSFDAALLKNGYSLGPGFTFSDSEGWIRYGETIDDPIALRYMQETPEEILVSNLESIARQNLLNVGLNQSLFVQCKQMNKDIKEYSITIG